MRSLGYQWLCAKQGKFFLGMMDGKDFVVNQLEQLTVIFHCIDISIANYSPVNLETTFVFLFLTLTYVSRQKELQEIFSLQVLNGGQHAGNLLAIQEFMLLPIGAKTFKEAMRMGSEVYHHLKAL